MQTDGCKCLISNSNTKLSLQTLIMNYSWRCNLEVSCLCVESCCGHLAQSVLACVFYFFGFLLRLPATPWLQISLNKPVVERLLLARSHLPNGCLAFSAQSWLLTHCLGLILSWTSSASSYSAASSPRPTADEFWATIDLYTSRSLPVYRSRRTNVAWTALAFCVLLLCLLSESLLMSTFV